MLQERDMLDREEKCAQVFRVQTEYREEREQIKGFYIKRFFWSNYLEIVSQSWAEACEEYEAQSDSIAEEVTTLPASSEEEAQAQFDEFVFVYDRDGFFEINVVPASGSEIVANAPFLALK